MSSLLLRDLGLLDETHDDLRLVTATIVEVTDERARCVLRDGTQVRLLRSEWYRNRHFAPRQRFVAVRAGAGDEVSATHPEVLRLLLESYVPEMLTGSVRVLAVAREPGVRSKVAVAATVEGVDAVGACVGKRSSRILAVAAALGGNERVEIVAWHPDPAVYVANALGPVGVTAVHPTRDGYAAVLPDHAYAAAVGGAATNVKLAGALCGWPVRVVSASAFANRGTEITDNAASTNATSDEVNFAGATEAPEGS